MLAESFLLRGRRLAGRALRKAGLRPPLPDPAPEPVDTPSPPLDPFDALPVTRHERPVSSARPIVEPIPVTELPVVWTGEADGEFPDGRGQLDDRGQRLLRERFGDLDPAACHWYHELPTADGAVIAGAWDLNGGEADYLGHIDLAGKRVFELGPASGHLTRWMEGQGAEVVAFDAGLDATIDLIPYGPTQNPAHVREAMQFISSVHRSWWWLHDEHGLAARCVYGSIYQPPDDLGRFDITTLSAVLLHLQSPFHAVRTVAAFTDEAIVVTDLEPPRPWGSTEMRFNPVEGDRSSWWTITPGAMQRMLKNVGFGDQTITRHVQWHRPGHVLDAEPIEMAMYTIVARRS